MENERRQLEIRDADYEAESLEDYVPQYLSEAEQNDLLKLLRSIEDALFSGKLGLWKGGAVRNTHCSSIEAILLEAIPNSKAPRSYD